MEYSFDKYCDLCDKYEDYTYRCDDWFPNKEECDRLIDNIKENFDLIVWILETATDNIKEQFDAEYSYLQDSFNEAIDFI